MKAILKIVLSFCLCGIASAKPNSNIQFLAYGKIPAWVGVASSWNELEPQIHFFNSAVYRGHADFVSKGLKTGINFKQFKQQVSSPSERKYLPFFVYDLSQNPIEVNGRICKWALHLEDYSYSDSPSEMQKDVLRLLKLIAKQFDNDQGLVLLATNPKVRPNIQIGQFLSINGFSHLTRNEMLANFGGQGIQILNPGTTYGYLKLIKAGEEERFIPNPNQIVIYETLPKRIYPVAGIISLEPQHELSHINLLAKNRRTVNLAIHSLEQLPNAQELAGQLVRLECSSKKVILSRAQISDAKKYWTSRNKKVTIPEVLAGDLRIVDLKTDSGLSLSIKNIGSKAANYARLLQMGDEKIINPDLIKPGLAIPFSFYLDFVGKNNIQTQINELCIGYASMNPEERKLALKLLRKNIKNGKLNSQLALLIRNKLKAFNYNRIRLRSSTNCEDLPDFNGAGLYQSKGFDMDGSNEELLVKIKKVYASLWSQQAFEERSFYGIDHQKAAMAILISPAYKNEYANGVLMTIPGDALHYQVNSQFGSSSVSNPDGDESSESLLFNAQLQLEKVQQESSIHAIFKDDKLERVKLELLQTAAVLHPIFASNSSYGIDIEFKIMKEGNELELYIKQIRLIGNHTLPE